MLSSLVSYGRTLQRKVLSLLLFNFATSLSLSSGPTQQYRHQHHHIIKIMSEEAPLIWNWDLQSYSSNDSGCEPIAETKTDAEESSVPTTSVKSTTSTQPQTRPATPAND